MRGGENSRLIALSRREAKKGSGDEIPRQVWAAAQRSHARSAISKNRSGAEGDNYDSGTARKNLSMIADILSDRIRIKSVAFELPPIC